MRFSLLFLLLTGGLLFVSCNGGNEVADTKDEIINSSPRLESVSVENKYTLTPFSESAAFPSATMASMSLKNGQYDFEVSGDYQLGVQTPDADQKMCANSAKGQHIHLIVDNQPYAARYTAEFNDYPIEDGKHHILAFLSRSYHESIKTDQAHKAIVANVKDNSIDYTEPIEGPMLFYSRPKGTYTGKKDTEKVMLDFYPIGANLGESEYKVLAEINGEKHTITNWQPYYITGLPMGENTIRLTLLGADGNAVDAPFNPVERTFTLKADELEN